MKWYKLALLLAIAIFISASFVYAQDVCCELTKSGQTCQYVPESECASGAKKAQTNCYFTSFCKPVCCFIEDEGRCQANMPLATCLANNGTFSDDASCESVAQCKKGCCLFGTEASFVTEVRCRLLSKVHGGLNATFRSDITDELSCVNLARKQEKGCCVKAENDCVYTTRDACGLPTGVSFGETGFFPDMYCSNPKLGLCQCTSHAKKGCLSGSDDVYWFDSCGNPEDIAKHCDYAEGELCGKNPNTGEYDCLSVNCKAPYDIYDKDGRILWSKGSVIKNGESWCEYDINPGKWNKGDIPLGRSKDLPGSRYYRGICINGKVLVEPCKDYREEWCVDDETTVGDEEYHVAACIVNKWQDCLAQTSKSDCENYYVRDCRWIDFGDDEGYCLPYIPPGFRFWEGEGTDICGAANSECTALIYISGLAKAAGDPEALEDLAEVTHWVSNPFGDQNTLNSMWQLLTGAEEVGEVKCIENCGCFKRENMVGMMNFCRSLGDCGAHFNVEGIATLNGFSRSPKDEGELEDKEKFAAHAFCQEEIPEGEERPPKCKEWFGDALEEKDLLHWKYTKLETGAPEKGKKKEEILYGTLAIQFLGHGIRAGIRDAIILGLTKGNQPVARQFLRRAISPFRLGLQPLLNAKENTFSQFMKDLFKTPYWMYKPGDVVADKVDLNKLNNILQEKGILKEGELVSQDNLGDVLEKFRQQDPDGYADFLKDQGVNPKSKPGKLSQGLNIAQWIWEIVKLYDSLAAEIKEVTISFECKPWQAPLNPGQQQCEACNPQKGTRTEFLKCSEYKCKSLGQGCELINQGTGNETCVALNPRDVTPPKISLYKEGLPVDYRNRVTETTRGYEITKPFDAYQVFTLAIQTDEPAKCKFSLDPQKPYEEMEGVFGSGIFDYIHILQTVIPQADVIEITQNGTMSFAPLPGLDYTLYIKCKDARGNPTPGPAYYIKFHIDQGPDVTPPIIEGFSIPDGTYVKYGINETDVTVFVNEPADCRWDLTCKNFEQMNHSLQCSSTPDDIGLYECTGKISPIIDQVKNVFYFRCKDQPHKARSGQENERNVMEDCEGLSIRGSQPLEIKQILPANGTVIYTRNVTLKVETAKGATLDGRAICYFGEDVADINLMTKFFKTNSSVHEQVLTPVRREKPYTYYVACIDYGGNIARANTTIKVIADTTPPVLRAVYIEKELGRIKIILDEPSECQYSLEGEFTFGDGTPMNVDTTEHEAPYQEGADYYIECLGSSSNMLSKFLVHT